MNNHAPAPSEEEIREIVAGFATLEGPLLPMLHALQHQYGHIPANAVQVLADLLNLGRAEVHGVVSFYHDFRDAPAGKHVLKICRAEACQSMGANVLAAEVLDKLGLDWHGTTPDGRVTVEPVYCLGMCACAPAAMMDDKIVARVDGARIDRLLQEVGAA